ncbi:MAG TPA: hypothetical protein VG838_00550 [Opitutaceae bacterium]|nr:hypothetical protein [Opitutaceae bacterium]
MTEESTVHDAVVKDLQARSKWEEKQPIWYKMRHTGIPRAKKPYKGAPDLHYPLADTLLDKLKPFYVQQIFSNELLADLVSERQQPAEFASLTAQWFDYKLKLKTNFPTQVVFLIDLFLQTGTGVLRPFWNARENRIEFNTIDPLYCIVPPKGSFDLQENDRFVHVECINRAEYAKRKAYNQDEEFIKSIAGKGQPNSRDWLKKHEQQAREGLTEAATDEDIIIWNVWEKEGGTWVLKTLTPLDREAQIMPPLKNPYQHAQLPYVNVPRELKEQGFYSSRGEVEKVAPHEAYACKVWNKKAEGLDFWGTPLLTSDDATADGKSINFGPGEFIPRGIRKVDFGQPPIGLDQELMNIRGIAEQRVGMPDFGIGANNNLGEARTATEVTQLTQLGGVTTDLRVYCFRLALQKAFKQAFSLAIQYWKHDLAYLFQQESRMAPKDALHYAYQVDVGGSAESWNKKLAAQKAQAMMQVCKGDPYIDQKELRVVYVETMDPRMVKRLVRDPNLQANTEATDEMVKIPAVMEGAPIPVEPQENHAVRAEIVFTKLQQLGHMGVPVDPIAQKGLVNRLNQRLAVWKQVDGKAANAWWAQKQQQLKAEAAQQKAAAGGAAPGANVVPFPGGQPATPAPAALAMAGGAQ